MFDYSEYLKKQKEYLHIHDYLFEYSNPHPDEKMVGDCVKRAITHTSEMDYKEVGRELNRYKKITKTKKFNEDKNWIKYIEKELGWKKLSGYHNMKLAEFAKTHQTGTYLITTRKHLTTIKDGKILDTWNPGFKAIGKVWKVK